MLARLSLGVAKFNCASEIRTPRKHHPARKSCIVNRVASNQIRCPNVSGRGYRERTVARECLVPERAILRRGIVGMQCKHIAISIDCNREHAILPTLQWLGYVGVAKKRKAIGARFVVDRLGLASRILESDAAGRDVCLGNLDGRAGEDGHDRRGEFLFEQPRLVGAVEAGVEAGLVAAVDKGHA